MMPTQGCDCLLRIDIEVKPEKPRQQSFSRDFSVTLEELSLPCGSSQDTYAARKIPVQLARYLYSSQDTCAAHKIPIEVTC